MYYIKSVLQPGETIVRIGKIHWITNLPGILVALVGLVLLVDGLGPKALLTFATVVELPLAYACLLVGVGLFLQSKYVQWTTEIGVTDRRVIQKSGFIARNTAEMNINQVERVEVNQSILGRILDYGTIRIHGSGQGLEALSNVSGPTQLRTCITAR